MRINMSRSWAMPSSNTFSIKPIKNLIKPYLVGKSVSQVVDPFVRNSPFKNLCISNDLDPDIDAQFHMDALDFLKTFDDRKVDVVLFDPPYSTRQVSECYRKLDKAVNMETTRSSFWTSLKREVGRIVAPNGICITCGWNSGGIGKSLGFSIEEILLVAHGGWHNDTIITVERKANALA